MKLNLYTRKPCVVFDDCSSRFEDHLNKDNSVTIHQGNIQQLTIEIFKVKIGIAAKIMNEKFTFLENISYNFRSGSILVG